MNGIQATARRAGALYFLFLIMGLVDMFGFSHFIVSGNAAAKAEGRKKARLTGVFGDDLVQPRNALASRGRPIAL